MGRPTARSSGLIFLLIAVFIGSVSGTYVVLGGGDSLTARLWQLWSADYSYTPTPLAISFSPQPATTALQQFAAAELDFAAVDDPFANDVLQTYGGGLVVQLPVVGNILVLTYNLPAANATLVLNGSVLADIYLGRIVMWDDAALVELNPSMNMPHANITTVYGASNATFDETSAFARTLASFSPNFAASFAAGMASLPPAQEGRSVGIANEPARLNYVSGKPYSLAYVSLTSFLNQTTATSLPMALMWNRSGRLLNASAAAVQSAMVDAQSQLAAGNLTADIFNGPGEGSWPLAYLSFVTFFVNRTIADCTPVSKFVGLLQWAFLNTQAANDPANFGYAPLIPSYVRRVLDSLNEFTCNAEPLLNTVAFFGIGPSYPVYTMWTTNYAGAIAEYNAAPTDSYAISELAGGNTDFAFVKSYPSPTPAVTRRQSSIGGDDDLVALPVVAFPYVPAYNIPTMSLSTTLAFDLPTIADIYLGLILRWNHGNISGLNPGVNLPNSPIRVVYPADGSFPVETDALYQLLSRAHPLFNASVSNASSTYSLVAALNTSVATDDVTSGLADFDNSFAVWPAVYLALVPQVAEGSVYLDLTQPPLSPFDLNPLLLALVDFGSDLIPSSSNNASSALYTLALGTDTSAWPLVGLGGMVFHTRATEFCESAQALADFLWWTQSSEAASTYAFTNNAVPASMLPQVWQATLQVLANATCQGKHVSFLYLCVKDGVLCSNSGSCSATGCQCLSGFTGTYCQDQSSGGSSTDTGNILGIVWGVATASCAVVSAVALGLMVVFVYRARKLRQAQDEGLMMGASEDPTPDIALDSIKIEGIDQVQAHRWDG